MTESIVSVTSLTVLTYLTDTATGYLMPSSSRPLTGPLLRWYGKHGRHGLPWRAADRSPFELLVAEILLQRTTAAAVSGAYVPFVTRYPTPEAVVAAPSGEIEDRIAPLGLSKRARFIERCSGQLLDRHSGRVPRCRDELAELHGVGAYTARSVAVHAFGEDVSAVDTNVRRLISRVFGLERDSDAIAVLADEIVPADRSSDFLHAALDFAADVCTPRNPECGDCPLGDDCVSAGLASDRSSDDVD